MLFLGHIGISLVLADATDTARAAAIAGNLLPDVVDKTGSEVLRVMPASRWLAHGLPFFALACSVSRLFLNDRSWRGFVLGYGGHLIADLYGGRPVPWFAPFRRPRRRPRPRRLRRWFDLLVTEGLGAFLIWRCLRS